MYSNILVPVAFDKTEDIRAPLDIARSLLSEGGTITLFHVFDVPPSYAMQYVPEDFVRATREGVLSAMKDAASGYDGVTVQIEDGKPGRTIVDHAAAVGNDLIVIASHRPGMSDIFWGSTAAYVVRHVACSVHVLRHA